MSLCISRQSSDFCTNEWNIVPEKNQYLQIVSTVEKYAFLSTEVFRSICEVYLQVLDHKQNILSQIYVGVTILRQ